jgi:hypothetical protein
VLELKEDGLWRAGGVDPGCEATREDRSHCGKAPLRAVVPFKKRTFINAEFCQ